MRYEITQDQDAESPRACEYNLGTMVCFHRRHNLLGDEQPKLSPKDWQRALACSLDQNLEAKLDWWDNGGYRRAMLSPNIKDHYAAADYVGDRQTSLIVKTLERHLIMLPIFIYDHSGISLSTSPFSCQWDSGQVGWIYMTREKAISEWGNKKLTQRVFEQAVASLISEVKIYDQFLTGDVWCYDILDDDDNIIESLCDCYGYECCEEEAKARLVQVIAEKEKQDAIDAAEAKLREDAKVLENEETLA